MSYRKNSGKQVREEVNVSKARAQQGLTSPSHVSRELGKEEEPQKCLGAVEKKGPCPRAEVLLSIFGRLLTGVLALLWEEAPSTDPQSHAPPGIPQSPKPTSH